MGTPEFAAVNLRALINAGFNVVLCCCQPDKPVGRKQILTPPPVKVEALQNGIEIYQPLKRAINFSMTHLGPHGMPAGLHADWNDCLVLGSQGESTFVAFQLYYALNIMKEFCENEPEYLQIGRAHV